MSIRLTYFAGLVAVCLLLLGSIYLQIYVGLSPCPLCTLQRLSFIFIGILFLVGMFTYSKRVFCQVINILSALTATLGIFLSGRQIWLQIYHAGDNNQCGVSLQYMLQVLPINEVMKKVLAGSAECTERGFEFLSLNTAEWALIWFIIFLCLSCILFIKTGKR